MKNKEISDYLDSFSKYLTKYDENLNTQGIWLFLATLGCWGVPEGWLRVTAFSITFFIFFNNLFMVWKEEKEHVTFKMGFAKVERKVDELESASDREFWTCVLNLKKAHHLSFIRGLKRNHIYIVSFVFHVVCLTEVLVLSKFT
ncbi:hypothetical protein QNS29_004828 [Vibrio parahaemolyticus]|nr:hypothetical protein [Vibrio parahaemolyticus]HCM1428269.1 hypothetical protein [Vibrio parahaemolyticus]